MKRPIPSRPELEKAAANLAIQIAAAREDLRRALVDARDTAAARVKVQELERKAAAVSQELAELDAAAEREAQRRHQVRADALVTTATDRLKSQLAGLQPPTSPWGP